MAPRPTAVVLPGLHYWRIQRALLQRELAERARVDLRHVQRLEAGGRAGLETVRRLAATLDVEPAQLMHSSPDQHG
jgi:transcriptional regulator with XRE-family HTH domain